MNKEAAYRQVRSALANGTLCRPDTCSHCGSRPPPAKDGRSNIHAHHPDYDRPLDVEWLCVKCHRKETPLPEKPGAPNYGSKNAISKLTEDQVLEIRTSNLSCNVWAKRLGLHRSTIKRAKNGTRWNTVPMPAPTPAQEKE